MTEITTEPNGEFFDESLYDDPDYESFVKDLDTNLNQKQSWDETQRKRTARALKERVFKIRNKEFDVPPLTQDEVAKTQKILDRINNPKPIPVVLEVPTLWISPPTMVEKFRNWFVKLFS
jgi:hypothetical protein